MDYYRIGVGTGERDIPFDIIEAAIKVCRWFDERNIKEWKLAGLQNRTDDLPVKPVNDTYRRNRYGL